MDKKKEGSDAKVKKPLYAREEMSRIVKWFFGLPLIYVAWVVVSFVMPSFSTGYRMELLLNIMSYCAFILIALAVIRYFLKFPIAKLLGENGHLDFKGLFIGFGVMFVATLGCSFINMWLQPSNFAFTL